MNSKMKKSFLAGIGSLAVGGTVATVASCGSSATLPSPADEGASGNAFSISSPDGSQIDKKYDDFIGQIKDLETLHTKEFTKATNEVITYLYDQEQVASIAAHDESQKRHAVDPSVKIINVLQTKAQLEDVIRSEIDDLEKAAKENDPKHYGEALQQELISKYNATGDTLDELKESAVTNGIVDKMKSDAFRRFRTKKVSITSQDVIDKPTVYVADFNAVSKEQLPDTSPTAKPWGTKSIDPSGAGNKNKQWTAYVTDSFVDKWKNPQTEIEDFVDHERITTLQKVTFKIDSSATNNQAWSISKDELKNLFAFKIGTGNTVADLKFSNTLIGELIQNGIPDRKTEEVNFNRIIDKSDLDQATKTKDGYLGVSPLIDSIGSLNEGIATGILTNARDASTTEAWSTFAATGPGGKGVFERIFDSVKAALDPSGTMLPEDFGNNIDTIDTKVASGSGALITSQIADILKTLNKRDHFIYKIGTGANPTLVTFSQEDGINFMKYDSSLDDEAGTVSQNYMNALTQQLLNENENKPVYIDAVAALNSYYQVDKGRGYYYSLLDTIADPGLKTLTQDEKDQFTTSLKDSLKAVYLGIFNTETQKINKWTYNAVNSVDNYDVNLANEGVPSGSTTIKGLASRDDIYNLISDPKIAGEWDK
ncbi:MAG: hypothetical protein NC236_00890 [Mycoplasma sp.]|nr:hypothetical protein [Mycoplasma sp.]